MTQEDIELLEQDGFGIDDDNDPVMENEPSFVETRKRKNKIDICEYKKWGWNGFDARQKEGVQNRKAKIIGMTEDTLKGYKLMDWFKLLMPMDWIEQVVIPETNKN